MLGTRWWPACATTSGTPRATAASTAKCSASFARRRGVHADHDRAPRVRVAAEDDNRALRGGGDPEGDRPDQRAPQAAEAVRAEHDQGRGHGLREQHVDREPEAARRSRPRGPAPRCGRSSPHGASAGTRVRARTRTRHDPCRWNRPRTRATTGRQCRAVPPLALPTGLRAAIPPRHPPRRSPRASPFRPSSPPAVRHRPNWRLPSACLPMRPARQGTKSLSRRTKSGRGRPCVAQPTRSRPTGTVAGRHLACRHGIL